MALYVGAFVIFLSVLGGAYFKGYGSGADSRDSEVAALQAAIASSAEIARDAEARASAAAAKVTIQYRDRIKTIREEIPGQIQLVEVVRAETPADCFLPPAYRELWNGPDSAPRNPAATDSPRVDAAPVPLADAAATAVEAKQRFRENAERLAALQKYVEEVSK